MCEYCNEDINKRIPLSVLNSFLNENYKIEIQKENMLFMSAGNFNYIYRKINYCPMCGRKLKGGTNV